MWPTNSIYLSAFSLKSFENCQNTLQHTQKNTFIAYTALNGHTWFQVIENSTWLKKSQSLQQGEVQIMLYISTTRMVNVKYQSSIRLILSQSTLYWSSFIFLSNTKEQSPFKTSNFAWAWSNANKHKQRNLHFNTDPAHKKVDVRNKLKYAVTAW